MSKISAEHLARGAYVYVRQSTADQLQHNHESRRRQYALAERARALGWSEVVVIDDDLGVSASGVARPGFDRLLAAICRGVVGAVVSVEASRLARNGRDWHTLLEFCALVGSLILDEDGVYDPRSPNDRLLLGMKGTFSEMELSLLRQRSQEALKLKAARGELHTMVAIGYVRGPGDRIEMDPDLRIREAIALVFRKFAELHSVRQVLLWLQQEALPLPSLQYGPDGRTVVWKLPVYASVRHVLTNPVYAGAYAFGRSETRVCIEEGRKKVRRERLRTHEGWQVLITEHHPGYIDWDVYEHNQRVIADNANRKGEMVRGALREGDALLTGLLRCGHCGRKLYVAYSGPRVVPAAIIAEAQRSITDRPASASPLGRCASTGPWRGKRCACSSRWVSRRRCTPSSSTPRKATASAGTWNSPWNKRTSKPVVPVVNTKPSIPITVWWPLSWSGAGTKRSLP